MTVHITLAQHEKQQAEMYERLEQGKRPHPNGIGCPNCDAELWDTAPEVMLPTNPPRRSIECRACYFKGTRLA